MVYTKNVHTEFHWHSDSSQWGSWIQGSSTQQSALSTIVTTLIENERPGSTISLPTRPVYRRCSQDTSNSWYRISY